jgi:two-component system, chemotaxis family, response regulator PixH
MSAALIVEDVQTDRMILAEYLESAGFQVIFAMNGEEALVTIDTNKPDIVFLDVVLPGRSGFEICRAIKSKKDTQKMDRFWGLKQGADRYLSKPLNRGELLDVLQVLAIPLN